MALGHDKDKRFLPKRFDQYAGICHGKGGEREVQLPAQNFLDQRDLKILPYIDLKIWKTLSAAADERRKHERSKCRDRAHGDSALQGRVVGQFLCRILHLKEDASGPFEKNRTCFREDGLAAHPVEKLVSKLALELYYLLAERRLGHVQSGGSSSEIPGVGDRHDVPKLAQFHR